MARTRQTRSSLDSWGGTGYLLAIRQALILSHRASPLVVRTKQTASRSTGVSQNPLIAARSIAAELAAEQAAGQEKTTGGPAPRQQRAEEIGPATSRERPSRVDASRLL